MKKKQITKAKKHSSALLPRQRSSKGLLKEAPGDLTTLALLGPTLQTIRVRLGLTQKAMADLCHLQVATISKIEKGDPGVRLGTLQTYLDAMNLTITLQEKDIQ